jgi:hypothetical protein
MPAMQKNSRWRTAGWCLLHCWIVYHLAALIIAPASVPPAAPVVQQCYRLVGPYLQLAHLNQGNHFFAPNPEGSTLISYVATRPDGEEQWGMLPNKQIKPRLNYHRYFMLTEHMAAQMNQRPAVTPLLVKTYANQLRQETGAAELVLSMVYHDLSSPAEVLAGRPIDDPSTYTETPLGEFNWTETESSAQSTQQSSP